MAFLRWLLHSVCTHVLGYPKDTKMQGTQIVEAVQGVEKSLKFPNGGLSQIETSIEMYPTGFQVPLHYPRYTKADYEKMEEWKVDMLLMEYGLNFKGTLDGKRAYAMGAFLWPDQV